MSAISEHSKYIAAKDWPRAEQALRRAAGLKTAGPDVFYDLAKVLEAAGKPEQMVTWLKRAVREHPGHSKAWLELGQILSRQGARDSALKCFETVAVLSRSDPKATRALGEITLRYGFWKIAARCFEGQTDPAAQIARYKIAAETGEATWALRQKLLADPQIRARLVPELTKVSKGGFPIKLS